MPPKPPRASVLAIGVVFFLAGAVGAQARVINDPFTSAPEGVGGDVLDFAGDPTGARVAFRAETLDTTRGVLYSAPADGSGPAVKLNGPLGPNGQVLADYRFSLDGSRVLYIGDETTNGAFHLYSVPSDGSGSPVRVSAGIVMVGSGVSTYRLSPDGTLVVFSARFNGTGHLYSAPVDGSAPAVQLDALTGSSGVQLFEISADSARVAYAADEVLDRFEVFSVPIDGSAAPVKLHPDFASGADAIELAIAPASDVVVYRADQDTNDVYEVYAAPIDGSSGPIKLNPALSGSLDVVNFHFTAAGDVLYRADQVTDETFDVYFIPADGSSAAVRVNPTLVAGGSVASLAVSADGTTGAYMADQDTDELFELYAFATDGSTGPDKISGTMPATGDVSLFELAADGARAIYWADQETDGLFDLWGTATNGTPLPVKLAPPGGNSALGSAAFSPEGDRVSFRGSGPANIVELFSAPADDWQPLETLNSHLGPEADVMDGRLLPNGRAAYIANKRQVWKHELFVAPADGSLLAKRIPVDLYPATGEVASDFVLSPRGNRVAFQARPSPASGPCAYTAVLDGTRNSVPVSVAGEITAELDFTPDGSLLLYRCASPVDLEFALFSEPADGSGVRLQLSQVLPMGVDADDFQVADDRIVFRVAEQGLFTVPPDGSQAPVQLNGALMLGGIAADWQLSRSADRVAYVARELTVEADLYTAPVDGSQGSVRINDPVASGEFVQNGYAFSPDGARVVYRVFSSGVRELFSAPSDGTGSPVKLNAPLVTDASVDDFVIGPNGQRVVYMADQDVFGVHEIFVVPIDGSAAPLRLNVPMPAFADVTLARFDTDGSRVVYRSDHEVNNTEELYSVSVLGGASTKLSDIGLDGGDVMDAILINTDDVVVYLQRLIGAHELFSVPIDASRAPVRLHQPLTSQLDVEPDFAFARDGEQVVFRANLELATPQEIWTAPVDGSEPPRRLNLPDPEQAVSSFALAPNGRKVVFLGGGPIFTISELYLSFLTPSGRKAPSAPKSTGSMQVPGN